MSRLYTPMALLLVAAATLLALVRLHRACVQFDVWNEDAYS